MTMGLNKSIMLPSGMKSTKKEQYVKAKFHARA
jgi:hypothetical protein